MIEVPVAVKEALKDGRLKKNYKISVLNDDGSVDFIIDNDNLVDESVNIDERLNSGDEIKFGLCEGSSLEFQYFDKPNITGKRVNVQLEVEYGDNAWYLIPMGYFDVQKCSRQASTGILKVTAYNKLMSDYLDAKANEIIEAKFGDLEEVYVIDIIDELLNEYAIDTAVTSIEGIGILRNAVYWYTGKNYNYKNLYGDRSWLSAGEIMIFNSSFSTSSKVLFEFSDNLCVYTFNNNYPVRVKNIEEFDVIDEQITALMDGALDLNIQQSGSIKSYLATVQVNTGYLDPNSQYVYLKGWYLHIEVIYRDGTKDIFGKTLYEKGYAKGTFKDLSSITLLNVESIWLTMPRYAMLGADTDFYNNKTIDFTNSAEKISYQYYQSSAYYPNNPDVGYTYLPKFANGDALTRENYTQRMSVTQILNLKDSDLIEVNIDTIPDITLRELQSAVFEMNCQYGQLDRQSDLFSGVELNKSRLYPATDLYPDSSLYPDGAAFSSSKSIYSQLWADDGNIRKWRYLIITYKTLDENNQEIEAVLQRTIDENGTDDYNMSDNWLFKNMIWTAADVGDFADAMVSKMQDITWFPFEMWLPGLPYIETGDEIEVSINENTYPTYVLQRQLKGIQNLQDTYINGTLDIF